MLDIWQCKMCIQIFILKVTDKLRLECNFMHLYYICHIVSSILRENRWTNMAVSLEHEVINYCLKNGSTVFSCLLEIRRTVWLYSTICVIPKSTWHHSYAILVYTIVSWYRKLTIQIKWGQYISGSIRVTKGTRHRGLSSQFRFNILYHDMIDVLSKTSGGITLMGPLFYLLWWYLFRL